MHTLATLASIIVVIVGIALSFAADVTKRLDDARNSVRRAGIEDRESGRVKDGPTAMERIRQELPARRTA